MSTIEEYAEKYNELSENNDYRQVPLIEHEWKVLHDSLEINTYLPSANRVSITTGIQNLKTFELDNFDSIDLKENIAMKRGHIINTGGSIWALDFVPKKASLHDSKQYLAVGGYNSTSEHHLFGKNNQCKNSIQIWQVSSDADATLPPKLDMCILHDFGVVNELKWCPFSVYEESQKLGILAVLFSDGDIRVFVVPHPENTRNRETLNSDQTVYIKVEAPRLLLKLPRTYNLCLAWGGYKKLACGTKSGSIVIWNILDSLLSQLPTVNINIPNASSASIRIISWLSLLNENLIISSDLAGNILILDLQDPFMICKIFRMRSTYVCISGTGHGSGFLFGDADGITRKNTTLHSKKSITLTMHNSLVWSIAVSPHHGIIASTGSDGSVMVKPYSSDEYAANPKHKLKVLEYTLYKLSYDPDTQILKYIDGLKPKTSLPDRLYHNILINPIVSINKAAWNNNKNACGWMASGGKAGLCRIEFTGC